MAKFGKITTFSVMLSLFCLGPATARLAAQEEEAQEETEEAAPVTFPAGVDELDRIAAVVGDTAILMSDITVTLYQLQARGVQIPPEGSEQWTLFVREVLLAMVDDLIYLQQAKLEGVTVDEEQVTAAADQFFQERRARFSSDEEMMQAVEETGMNMLQYRQMLRAQSEADALKQAYLFELQRRTDLPTVIVSEEEIEAEFDAFAEGQPPSPALVSFNRLVVTPTPSGEARDSARARVGRVRAELLEEEDFAIVARRRSDDQTTREQGGELGWMSRDLLVKPFGDAAWSSRSGAVVGPVQTQFGVHFIKVERQRGAERFLRHILLRPELGDNDFEDARTLASDIADSLRAGVSPEQLAGYYRGEVAEEEIRYDDIQVTALQSQFTGDGVSVLATPTPGEVYGPLAMERGGPTEFGIVQVVDFRPEGPVTLDDVRDQIRTNLRTQKQIEVLLLDIRDNTYIDIRL